MPAIARRLIAAVKQLDTTRPVTMALADIDASNATGVASMLDVTGYNYLEQHYARDHKAYPTRVIYGSENSRNLEAWRSVAVNDYVGGQFLWTGMDYLGEGERYPSRGFESGLLDLEGFWKPEGYLRQALWSDKPMIYAAAWGAGSDETRMAAWPRNLGRTKLVERWGWTGDPRKNIPVEIYTNCDSVELVLNGRSLGEKAIADHLMPALLWAAPNEAGTLEVLGKKAGTVAARFELKSIGQPETAGAEPRPENSRERRTPGIHDCGAGGGSKWQSGARRRTFGHFRSDGRRTAHRGGQCGSEGWHSRNREPGEIVSGQGGRSGTLGCRVRQDHGPRHSARVGGGRVGSQLGGRRCSSCHYRTAALIKAPASGQAGYACPTYNAPSRSRLGLESRIDRFLQRSFASAILMVWGCSSVG